MHSNGKVEEAVDRDREVVSEGAEAVVEEAVLCRDKLVEPHSRVERLVRRLELSALHGMNGYHLLKAFVRRTAEKHGMLGACV